MPSYKSIFIVLLAFACIPFGSNGQDQQKPLIIDLSYNVKNNHFPFVGVLTKTKVEKQFPPVAGMEVNVYISEESEDNLLGKVKTDHAGKAYLTIAPKFKLLWDSLATLNFIAVSPGNKEYEATNTEMSVTKAIISIDTVVDAATRSLTASIFESHNGNRMPANEVELKIIIGRMAGNLSAGEEESYTTDSTGSVIAEFNKDSIPGDKEGYITIIAKTEDNDTYGNISVEKKVKWGIPLQASNEFNKRSLFATRDKSPLWLLFLAYSTALGVWATILYLLTRIWRMRAIGRQGIALEPDTF